MKYINAKSKDEALKALKEGQGQVRLIAGGTDVSVDVIVGKYQVDTFVDISRCDDLKGIRIEGKELVIGAATTLTEISRNELVKKYFPSVSKGTGSVGSLQIRNIGTLTGNIITALPAADGAMSVAPLNTKLKVVSAEGEKLMDLHDTYAGMNKSNIDPSKELVTEIRIPLPEDDEKASYIRLQLRKSLSLPMLNVAAMVKYDGSKIIWARITMGPLGAGPMRATRAEEFLKGKEFTKENMEEAGKLALSMVKPRTNPLRGSKEYRSHSLPILVRRALEEVLAQY